jgi:hypothetical protein
MSNQQRRPELGRHGAFNDRLRHGAEAERLVALWAQRHGWTPVPLAELPATGCGGPRISTPKGEIVAPDLVLVRDSRSRFVEIKRRTSPTLHRATGTLCTGIETHALHQYLRIARATGTHVWLVFMHDSLAPDLRGGDIELLDRRVHHTAAAMAYWALRDLPILASSQELAELRRRAGDA